MEFSTQLLQKKEQLIEKSKDKPHEALYYKMLEATIEELISLGAHVEKLKENLFTKSSFKAYQSEWEEMMEEIGEALDLLIEMPYKVVKAKKIYEDVDAVFADLEDWIESLNEEAFMESEPLSYIENWDIGLFF